MNDNAEINPEVRKAIATATARHIFAKLPISLSVNFKGLDPDQFDHKVAECMSARNKHGYNPLNSWIPFIRGVQ